MSWCASLPENRPPTFELAYLYSSGYRIVNFGSGLYGAAGVEEVAAGETSALLQLPRAGLVVAGNVLDVDGHWRFNDGRGAWFRLFPQSQVSQDMPDDRPVLEESDDPHSAAALGTKQRVHAPMGTELNSVPELRPVPAGGLGPW